MSSVPRPTVGVVQGPYIGVNPLPAPAKPIPAVVAPVQKALPQLIVPLIRAWEDSITVDNAPPFNVVHPLSWVRKVKVPELLAALKAAGFE